MSTKDMEGRQPHAAFYNHWQWMINHTRYLQTSTHCHSHPTIYTVMLCMCYMCHLSEAILLALSSQVFYFIKSLYIMNSWLQHYLNTWISNSENTNLLLWTLRGHWEKQRWYIYTVLLGKNKWLKFNELLLTTFIWCMVYIGKVKLSSNTEIDCI